MKKKKEINKYNEQVQVFESLIREEAIRVEELLFGVRERLDEEHLYIVPSKKKENKKKK